MPRNEPMSVQRWDLYVSQDDSGHYVANYRDDNGAWVTYADHARIVAEMEQAHAAALDSMKNDAEARYYDGWRDGKDEALRPAPRTYVCNNPDHRACTGCDVAAAPRTLTADDPEPAVTSVGLDRDQSVWQRVGSTEHSRWVNPFMGTREWSDVLARGPVLLIHDSGAA